MVVVVVVSHFVSIIHTVQPVRNGHSERDLKLVLNTNYRLMQVKSIAECSLSTFIKLPFVIKIFVLFIFEWPLKTGFTVRTCVCVSLYWCFGCCVFSILILIFITLKCYALYFDNSRPQGSNEQLRKHGKHKTQKSQMIHKRSTALEWWIKIFYWRA